MSASSRFAMAVHALAVLGYLERQGVPRLSSRLISRSVNTHAVVIRSLLVELKKAGLIESKEGKAGGVSLARPPARITLREIYAAVEGSAVLRGNPNPVFKPCPVSRGMKRVLPALFRDVDRAVERTLQDRTLAQVIDELD